MVIMFNRDQAALLSIQLYVMGQVFAGTVDICGCDACFSVDSFHFYLFHFILTDCFPSMLEILSQTDEHRNMLVSRGDPVILICNISKTNATQISWTKGRSFFAHLVSDNKTVSNFTSHKIDINLPSKLNISNVQHDDAGLYKCDITDRQGRWTIKWNLTVSGEPQGM